MKSTLNNQPTSIILADIDHFKWVNDEHGHIAGDYVLSCVAKQLQSLIDTDGWAARYGGEEFLICLIATETQAAAAVAEKMRAAIEAAPIKYDCTLINITMSFGVSTTQGETIPVEAFIDAADQKMYTAKQNGRNQVVSQVRKSSEPTNRKEPAKFVGSFLFLALIDGVKLLIIVSTLCLNSAETHTSNPLLVDSSCYASRSSQ